MRFLLEFVLLQAALGVLVRVKDFSVLYKMRKLIPLRFLGTKANSDNDDTVVVLNHVSASFRDFTALVGVPGSGKSTLAKALHRRCSEVDQALEIVGGGEQIFTMDIDSYDTAYIDEFYYDTYSPSKSVEETCLPLIKTDRGRKMYELCLQSLKLPIDVKIRSLMETQRRCFELMLALIRLESEIFHTIVNEERSHKEETASRRCVILLLDEYFDKDAPSVVRNVFTSLRVLRQVLEESEVFPLIQVVAVSHCQVVAGSADWVVAIHKGSVFHEQVPSLLRLPAQFEWRQ